MIPVRARVRVVAALLCCLLLAGCGGKVSKENYDRINTGMSEKEVEDILGSGEEQASAGVAVPGAAAGGLSIPGASLSAKNKVWKDGNKMITVSFLNGKVAAKVQTGL